MKKILIANSKPPEAEKIKTYLQKYFQITLITDPGQFNWDEFVVILIDHNFTSLSGIDFLMNIIGKRSAPVLMLTPPEDPQCAIEALRSGAFNYIVKTGNYFQFLYIAITDAINKYEERAELKNTIKEMTAAIKDLEKRTGVKSALKPKAVRGLKKSGAPAASVDNGPDPMVEPEPEREINLLEEIVSRFKKGEVNLPTLPQVHVKFNELIRKGANLKEVADFLKQDVAISTKLINASNSALYRGLVKVGRLEDAVNRLGLGATRQYVEIISNRSLYTSSNKRFSGIMGRLWEHSLACACAAEFIHSLLSLKSEADIFSLGLTHDVGKLVLLQVIGELSARDKAVEKIGEEEILETLDLYHGRFGAVLLKRWAFPETYRDVAMYHNHIDRVETPTHEYLCVHFANCLVNSMGVGIRAVESAALEDLKSYQLLRLRTEEIHLIQDRVKEYLDGIRGVV